MDVGVFQHLKKRHQQMLQKMTFGCEALLGLEPSNISS
jgi:hypothetical protein